MILEIIILLVNSNIWYNYNLMYLFYYYFFILLLRFVKIVNHRLDNGIKKRAHLPFSMLLLL